MTLVTFAVAPGCQVISGEADRQFEDPVCANAVACDGCGTGACCVEDCGAACECMEGCTCHLSCPNPPCAVDCGKDVICFAECAGADCRCDDGSTCDFHCREAPCVVRCDEDADSCILHCDGLAPDTDDCKIDGCNDDDLTICPGGTTLVCRGSCP
jgi:hypothetical protein